jgi:pyruvate kinase
MFPHNKTKLVCTIGPASDSPEVILRLLDAGMNIARLNYSHGDFAQHKVVIDKLRRASSTSGHPLAIMADLPGPKMRIGKFASEPVVLVPGADFCLTTEDIVGDETRVSVSFAQLPSVVHTADKLYLNDGIIQVEVDNVHGNDVNCRVVVGGELRSHKGLNLPGIDLGVSAFTDHDRDCMRSALENGVDAVSQSFVENAADIEAVRKAAAEMGYHPFIIAKIERSGALGHLDEILHAADGIMVARGDLGVEIPMERIAVVQKQITRKANLHGKPVITATQLLESMVGNPRPTRAEATDVANAVLDGTDCVMLSEESAMGQYPVEAVHMLAKIAAAAEPFRPTECHWIADEAYDRANDYHFIDLMSRAVREAAEHLNPSLVLVPTASGRTARMISRFKLPTWILAVSSHQSTCQGLQFSYGVHPIHEPNHPSDWNGFARKWVTSNGLAEGVVLLTEGPSRKRPNSNHRLEIIDLRQG